MSFRNERMVVHDRARGTLREKSRQHFLREQKEMEHELSASRDRIMKLLNDGYLFESSSREDNHYELHFKNPRNMKVEDCWLSFESNFAAIEPILNKDNKDK